MPADADAIIDDVPETVDSLSVDGPSDLAGDAGDTWLPKATDVAWTYLEVVADDPDVASSLPVSPVPDLPTAPKGCWSEPWGATAPLGEFSSFVDVRVHVFVDGSWLVYASDLHPWLPAAVWRVKDSGKSILQFSLPQAGTDDVGSNPGLLASSQDGSAVLAWRHNSGVQLFWFHKTGSMETEAYVAMPGTGLSSMAVDASGFVFGSVFDHAWPPILPMKHGIVGLSKGAASGWILPTGQDFEGVYNTIPGLGALVERPQEVRLISKQGKWTAVIKNWPDSAGTFAGHTVVPDGKSGMYAQFFTSYKPFAAGFAAVARLDSLGELVWVEPFMNNSQYPNHSLADHAVGIDDTQYADYGVLVRTKDGVALSAPGSQILARWTADGRRLPDIRWKSISPDGSELEVAATPLADGGFAVATAGHVARINAAGSATCKGCGPTAPSCDDADPCTADACNADLGDCTHVPILACKKSLGTCIGDADCDDGEPCTADTCAKATGACTNAPQAKCHLGNRCVGWVGPKSQPATEGTCVQGKCTPPDYVIPDEPGTQGWVARTHCTRPQVFEAKAGELFVAGCWHAMRLQKDGVLRWRHQMTGQISAAAVTPDDGLLLVVKQAGAGQAEGTRLVRLSAQGKVVSDAVVTTGLPDWYLVDAWRERQRWLVARPEGGFALVGTLAWTADAWQGRVVELSAQGSVLTTKNVTIAGLGGAVPKARSIDQVWPAPDGGLYVGWHRLVQGAQRTWGAAHLAATGQVLWNQPLTAAPVWAGGFDPWRPQGAVVSYKAPLSSIAKVALLPGGPGTPVAGDTTNYGTDFGSQFSLDDVLAYAQLPGERTVSAFYDLEDGEAADGTASDFGDSATWPPALQWDVPLVQNWLELAGHAVADVFVLSDKRVVLSVSHPPGWYLYPALIVLDGNGRFRPCGTHPKHECCPYYPFGPCCKEAFP